MAKDAQRQKEIFAVMQRLETEAERLKEGIDTLEESLVQVLHPEGEAESGGSERQQFATPLGRRLDTLLMQLQERNDYLSDIANRLEV